MSIVAVSISVLPSPTSTWATSRSTYKIFASVSKTIVQQSACVTSGPFTWRHNSRLRRAMFHSYRCLHLQSYHSIQSRGSDFAIFAVAWRSNIMNDEADRFIASLESAGLEEVRTRLATDRYGEAGNRRAIAENWVRQKEREAEE